METTSSESEAILLKVEGIVQRVGFRRFAERTAWESKLTGYVENVSDGSVKIFVQGTSASLEEFQSRVRQAPEPIFVERIASKKAKLISSIRRFTIKTGSSASEMQEGFGVMESQFGDYRKEFKNYREEFRGFASRTDQNLKSLNDNFNDYRSEFQNYREEFRGLSSRTEENFKLLGDKYGEISQKMTQVLETLEKESTETRRELARAMEKFDRESSETKKELTRAVDKLSSLVDEYIKKSSTGR